MTYNEAVVKIQPYSIWKHYKGKYYKVCFVARHTETDEPIVIYQSLPEQGIFWARPASMWFDEVSQGVHRFELQEVDRSQDYDSKTRSAKKILKV